MQLIIRKMSQSKWATMIKCFDGTCDVSTWLEKVKLVVELQELGALEKVIPLFWQVKLLLCIRTNGHKEQEGR